MTGGRRGQGGFGDTSPAGSTVNDGNLGRGPGKETLVQRLESLPIFARALDTPTGTKMAPGAELNSPANAASPLSPADDTGQALPDDVLARMNKRFGHDFSHVRIHTGPAGARLAANLGAKALTQGAHIYFGQGQFAPGTAAGDRLLIHELTHVVQHDQGRTSQATSDDTKVADPNGPEEREASTAEHAAEPGARRGADSLHEPSPSLGSPARAQGKSSSSPPRNEAILRDPLPVGAAGDAAAVGQLQALFTRAGVPSAQQQLPQATLTISDATRLFNAALRAQPSLMGVGPRMVAARLMQDVIMTGADTSVSTVAQRLSTFGPIIILRPDGYIARALTGEALQRAGKAEFVDGSLRAGGLSAGTFYYSDGGVFYRADDGLRRTGPPIGELGLEHDALNSALDGAADALVAMAAGLYQLIRHPIQSVEALTQLPGAVAQLIRNSPVYWELFRAMPLNDQIREVSKIVTTLVTLYGSAAGATTRIAAAASDLGNITVRALTLSNTGELAWATVSVPIGTVATALSGGPGAVYVLHMTNSSLNNSGGSGGNAGGGSSGGGSGGGPGRLIVPAGRTLSVEETAIANQLVAEGRTVEALAEGTTRTADFLVDGVRTELKSISNITSSDPSGALGRRILDGAGQAPNIIADVRAQAGMTEELARRAARRAYGADSAHRIQSVRLIGQGFDVTIPRITAPPTAR